MISMRKYINVSCNRRTRLLCMNRHGSGNEGVREGQPQLHTSDRDIDSATSCHCRTIT